MESPEYRRALQNLNANSSRTFAETVTLSEIPAPPFGEDARAAAFLAMMKAHGLENVHRDEVGNVIGVREGSSDRPAIVIWAHLDTVFTKEVDVKVGERAIS